MGTRPGGKYEHTIKEKKHHENRPQLCSGQVIANARCGALSGQNIDDGDVSNKGCTNDAKWVTIELLDAGRCGRYGWKRAWKRARKTGRALEAIFPDGAGRRGGSLLFRSNERNHHGTTGRHSSPWRVIVPVTRQRVVMCNTDYVGTRRISFAWRAVPEVVR